MDLSSTMLLSHMCQQQIHTSNTTYTVHGHQWGEVYQYTCQIWTDLHWPYAHEYCTQTPMAPMMTVTLTMMMPQPNCISWVGHWPNQPKLNMVFTCKLTAAMTNKCICMHMLHVCIYLKNFTLLQQNLCPV